ncbi:hypothetical protein BCR37DRAFT_155536 [Protomyces lactucae-debilis]|uniref:Uncharacterized protein n=1 Tax=Protomyces lactucae-debilis TaxID=2754530 RepID=A0A1Y2F0K7_PROLT|nr:uncharacterized protein BCR37DRAFT_155536 [Protomyces lactucae-debilis]ORY77418.1 hypothetical protein BCR37DRAFT_155536 [Protomyces lactucae-debilis]
MSSLLVYLTSPLDYDAKALRREYTYEKQIQIDGIVLSQLATGVQVGYGQSRPTPESRWQLSPTPIKLTSSDKLLTRLVVGCCSGLPLLVQSRLVRERLPVFDSVVRVEKPCLLISIKRLLPLKTAETFVASLQGLRFLQQLIEVCEADVYVELDEAYLQSP